MHAPLTLPSFLHRSEAKGVPLILTSTPTGEHGKIIDGRLHGEELLKETDGYFDDGAYTAAPLPPSESRIPPAQQRYYESLLARFASVRASLNDSPPLTEIQQLRSSQLISFPTSSAKAREQWEEHILNNDPHPVQLACMDGDSIFELIGFLTRRMARLINRNEVTVRRVGAWAWAALARCRDRGELGSEETSELRSFATRAATVLGEFSATEPELRKETAHDEGISTIASPTSEPSKGDSKAATIPGLKVVLDIIITIVGELYGQRDLLETREVWLDTVGNATARSFPAT